MADKPIDFAKIAKETVKYQNELKAAEEASVEALKQQQQDAGIYRDILSEISKSLKIQKIEYNDINNTFGKSVEKLSITEKLQNDIQQNTQLVNAYNKDIARTLEESVRYSNDLNGYSTELSKNKLEQQNYEKTISELLKNKNTLTSDQLNKLGEAEIMMGLLKEQEDVINATIKDREDLLNKNNNKIGTFVGEQAEAVKHGQKLEAKLFGANASLGIANKLTGGMAGGMMDLLNTANPYLLAMKAVTAIIEIGVDNFLAFDKAATQTRKDLGLVRGEADGIEKTIKDVTLETMDMGVQYQDVANTIKSLSNNFSTTLDTNKELVKNVTLMSTQLGISADESSEFLKVLGGVTGTSAQSNQNMMGFAQQMAKASGIPLGSIMKDVSEAARNSSAYIKADAVGLVKAAAEARLMGTTLEKMAHTSKALLDFNTSISDEMEASVLLGKNINLQTARNLAYHGKTVEANKEILKITKQVNFSKMDPMQMEAFAKATGKSVGELQDMIEADKRQQALRELAAKDPSVKKQLDDLQKMKDMKKAAAADLGKQALLDLQRQSNQERMNALQDKFNQLMAQLAEPVMDIVEPLLSVATYILPAFIKYGLPIVGWFKMLGIEIKIITKSTEFLRNIFAKVLVFLRGFGTTGKFLATIFSKFAGFFGIVGKFLGPIGLIINAFQFINALMKRWHETPKGFLGGLMAIKLALYDVFLKPFVDVWNWIKNLFVGKSSKLGLGILDGIKSVGGMIFNALTFPYRMLWQFIKKIFPSLGSIIMAPLKIFSSLGSIIMAPLKGVMGFFGGVFFGIIKSVSGMIFNALTFPYRMLWKFVKKIFSSLGSLIMAPLKGVMSFVGGLFGGKEKPKELTTGVGATTTPNQTATANQTTTVNNSNEQIIQKLDELISLMKSGGIAINIDGKRASYLLATASK
jgi:hypothetical protein